MTIKYFYNKQSLIKQIHNYKSIVLCFDLDDYNLISECELINFITKVNYDSLSLLKSCKCFIFNKSVNLIKISQIIPKDVLLISCIKIDTYFIKRSNYILYNINNRYDFEECDFSNLNKEQIKFISSYDIEIFEYINNLNNKEIINHNELTWDNEYTHNELIKKEIPLGVTNLNLVLYHGNKIDTSNITKLNVMILTEKDIDHIINDIPNCRHLSISHYNKPTINIIQGKLQYLSINYNVKILNISSLIIKKIEIFIDINNHNLIEYYIYNIDIFKYNTVIVHDFDSKYYIFSLTLI